MSDRYQDVDIDDYNISASQVKTHSTCPLQYALRYVEGKEATKSDSVYITLGNRVHETLEDMLGGEEHPPFHDRQILRNILAEHYIQKEDYYLPQDEYERGLKCVQKAADVLHREKPTIRDVEIRKEYDINRMDMSTGVTATMDVATDGEIWDWKTGRVRPDDTPHEETIQGAIYLAAYYHLYGENPEAIKFYYLSPDARKYTDGKEDGPCVHSVEPNDENWQYMLRYAKELEQAKTSMDFPANPGEHCYWCSYELWCPETAVGVGDVDWEDY